jgi:alkylhydroperoxidase family enzyme
MSYLPSSPYLSTLASVLKKYPRRGVLLFKLLEDINKSFSPLSKNSRELIITYISALNHGNFGHNVHKSVVNEQLRVDIENASIDEKLKPILRFVKKLTLTPDDITPKDAQTIFDAGWVEQDFLDVVYLSAIVNCMNRFVIGIGADEL